MMSMTALAAALLSISCAQGDSLVVGGATLKPVPAKALQDETFRSLTIELVIEASMVTPINLDYADLNGGAWDQPPLEGTGFQSGDRAIYTVVADDPHETLGGSIELTMAYGNLVTIEFGWEDGSAATCDASDPDIQALALQTELEDSMSTAPVCTVYFMNPPGTMTD
ncbi:hypothetical protein [Maricaulis sp.]|uniref:hypothetical protein n=1 Tax=Maricaulis sp. TaxID=1486257 RepID=UPI003A9197A6